MRQVTAAMNFAHARGNMTSGRCLTPNAAGFPASTMTTTRSGDWCDPEHVREWITLVERKLAT